MREIKFRLWDTGLNKWASVCNQLLNRDGAEKYYSFNQNNRFIYQQFTGLKDKNGNDIYEGDIIEYEGMTHGYPNYVKWTEEVKWEGPRIYCPKINRDLSELNFIRIIGNIFGNPEVNP
jgi:hypothetical protein